MASSNAQDCCTADSDHLKAAGRSSIHRKLPPRQPDDDDDASASPALLNSRRRRPRASTPPAHRHASASRVGSTATAETNQHKSTTREAHVDYTYVDTPSDEEHSDVNDILSLATMSLEDHASPRHEQDDEAMIQSPSTTATTSLVLTQQQRQQEDESIALARRLMEQEAMHAYAASADYLRYNAADFSQEDYDALQAALAVDEDNADDEAGDDEPDLTYDMMLRLGDTLGDVKQERWTWVAQSEIDKLRKFQFDSESVKDLDENDPLVKCLVCQLRYETGDDLRRLPCAHCFHCECIDHWLREKEFCPYCRKSIVTDVGDFES